MSYSSLCKQKNIALLKVFAYASGIPLSLWVSGKYFGFNMEVSQICLNEDRKNNCETNYRYHYGYTILSGGILTCASVLIFYGMAKMHHTNFAILRSRITNMVDKAFEQK